MNGDVQFLILMIDAKVLLMTVLEGMQQRIGSSLLVQIVGLLLRSYTD